MKVAFVGMGKLGFPCALAAAAQGHDVVGYDVSPGPYDILANHKYPHREEGAQELLDKTTLRMVLGVGDVVRHADIVFVAVQTPHKPEFEGLNRMPDDRADFDYGALVSSVRAVAHEALRQRKRVTIVVISTCLPGTCDREVKPHLNEYTGFVYNPFFIAMGTTISDYLNPEFVLLGCNEEGSIDLELVQKFYMELHGFQNAGGKLLLRRYQAVMSVVSAELCKVFYNVFLGQKINMANAMMEIAHKVGANCDDVTNALACATDRVVSIKYMYGGMGDGGGCHPRDQIALSWLAQELNLSRDVFADMIAAREAQTEWLADLAEEESRDGKLPILILGKAYKKGTNLTLGSPAILLKNILDERPHLKVSQRDPHVDDLNIPEGYTFGGWRTCDDCAEHSFVFIIATDHDEFFSMKFPAGSVVIDPWGKMADQDGVKVIRVGRR